MFQHLCLVRTILGQSQAETNQNRNSNLRFDPRASQIPQWQFAIVAREGTFLQNTVIALNSEINISRIRCNSWSWNPLKRRVLCWVTTTNNNPNRKTHSVSNAHSLGKRGANIPTLQGRERTQKGTVSSEERDR
jgi:hypothetical protein